MYAEVVGHGEVWSARLMAAVLQHLGVEAAWLDELLSLIRSTLNPEDAR